MHINTVFESIRSIKKFYKEYVYKRIRIYAGTKRKIVKIYHSLLGNIGYIKEEQVSVEFRANQKGFNLNLVFKFDT